MNIKRKARGGQIPKQASRVFLCLDPQNMMDTNKLISNLHDIKYGMDCVVSWLETPEDIDEDALREELYDTHALVVWVTIELLQSISANRIPKEFIIARELKRPIIPIANDDSLFVYFTELVGAIHGIAISDPEYHEKLKKQLENFLITEELIKQIEQKAFTAKIFLSYRKMDIKKAREFMKKFHSLTGFETISIWYDNFLTVGRVFDDEIKQSILASDAFTLLVTPNLLKKNDEGRDNYVVSTEYPFARDNGKAVIPVEAERTDSTQFSLKFNETYRAVWVDDAVNLSAAFKTKLNATAFIEEMENERVYLLGMAYLRGYGVERDFDRAVRLLEKCANGTHYYAYEAALQLVFIYGDGSQTEINYGKELHWAKRTAILSEHFHGKTRLTAEAYQTIGISCDNQSKYDEALEMYQKAIEIYTNQYGEHHPYIADVNVNIALIYGKQDKHAEALELYHKDLEICERLQKHFEHFGDDDVQLRLYQRQIAQLCGNIAIANHIKGEYSKALEWHLKALEINEKILGKEHPGTAKIYNGIANVYYIQGQINEALEWHLKALKIKEKVLGKDHPSTAITYHGMALTYCKQNKYNEALELSQKALEVREKVFGKEHPETASTVTVIASTYFYQKEYDKALELFLETLKIHKKIYGEKHSSIADIYSMIATTYSNQGEYDKALELYQQAYNIYVYCFGENHPNVKRTVSNIHHLHTTNFSPATPDNSNEPNNLDEAAKNHQQAMTYYQVDRYEKSLSLLQLAFKTYSSELGMNHPKTESIIADMQTVFIANGGKRKTFLQWLEEQMDDIRE